MDDWKQTQDDLRAGVYGDWSEIRTRIAEDFAAESPGHGLGSSDVNHIAYGWVKSGMLTKQARPLTQIEIFRVAYPAALAVARTEDADERQAKDRANAIAGVIGSAVANGEDPGAWFKPSVRNRPANVAAVEAVRAALSA